MNLFLTSVVDGIESINALKKMINEQTKLIVLPFAHDYDYLSCTEDVYNRYDRNPYNTDSIFYKTVKSFVNIGIDYDNIVVINHFADPISLIKHKLLAPNTIVYLPGGRPENIIAILNRLDLVKTIKQCETIVGESAGSMIWSKHFFVYPDQDYKKYHCFKGLGLIKHCVYIPHFNIDNKKSIVKCAKRFRKFHKGTIYFVKDGGWIQYNVPAQKIIRQKDSSKFRRLF